jgi:ribonuclease Y
MEPITVALIAVVCAAIGAGIGFVLQSRRQQADQSRLEKEAEDKATVILKQADRDAENVAKDAEIRAKERQIKAERESESRTREQRRELNKTEQSMNQRGENLDRRASSLDRKESELNKREAGFTKEHQRLVDRERELDKRTEELVSKLEDVARLSQEEARTQIIEAITEKAKLQAAKSIREIEEEALTEADRRAKKILSVTIQRYAGEYVTERCVSIVSLPSDDMKGRIIGREGRNIRALEAATGVDLIVDDTPEAVILSAFDPIRRETARISLERLISDGRIHPSRIEEVVKKTKKELDKTIRAAGEQAAFELGLTGLHPELIRLIGRLKYRTSYGQNQWAHSIEVGFLCGLMAGELGLNVKLARRCGLLHDIGKTIDHESEGSHAIIGASYCKKHGEKEIIINAVAAHHDEVKPTSVFAHLVMAGDALSGARPGARREVLEGYIKRLEDLERISKSFGGVSECYAIQAGRELRVMVEADRVSDDQALILSKDIAEKIEADLVYPGQIRVCVIRETRAVEYAK